MTLFSRDHDEGCRGGNWCECVCFALVGVETPAQRRASRRRATAYVRFLTLDVARAEAGRLMLALENRERLTLSGLAPTMVLSHQQRLLRRVQRARGLLEGARQRHAVLSRLCERAREIARRLGCFDGVVT